VATHGPVDAHPTPLNVERLDPVKLCVGLIDQIPPFQLSANVALAPALLKK
jgi:hypothetical protein